MAADERAPDLLKPSEVAKALRVHKMTVYRMIHKGDLPSIRVGDSFRVPADAVRKIIRPLLGSNEEQPSE